MGLIDSYCYFVFILILVERLRLDWTGIVGWCSGDRDLLNLPSFKIFDIVPI